MIYIGRCVPKALTQAGWREASAMHLGHGCWLIRLVRNAPKESGALVDRNELKESYARRVD